MGRKSETYWVIFLVLAFHAALLATLAVLSRYRIAIVVAKPLEVVFLPSNRKFDKPLPPVFNRKIETRAPRFSPDSLFLILAPQPVQESAQSGLIDWAAEAARAVGASANAIASSSKADSSSKPDQSSKPDDSWFPAPQHYKGEEIPSSNGETMVFINDHCYVVSSVFRSAPTASNNGMGMQTYCLGESNVPRGDLFKDFAAYKRMHPDP